MVIKTTLCDRYFNIRMLQSNQCDHNRENQQVSEKKEVFKHEDASKMCILLQDEMLDWLKIWTTASSLNVKGNKAIKKKYFFFLFNNRAVF